MTAALISRNGRLLLCKRAEDKRLGGYWEFPGGKVEDGETDRECLKRELSEELCIDSQILRFIAENDHDYGDFSLTLVLYETEIIDGSMNPTDHDEIDWIRPSDLHSMKLAPADIPLVDEIIKFYSDTE